MRVSVDNVVIVLKPTSCAECQIDFAIDERLWAKLHEKGQTFYCPNGHPLWYGKGDLEKAKQRIRSLESMSKWTEQRLESEKRYHAATKGKLTKIKNRIANGVCPCCNRSFQNLYRHMAGQHPDYVKAK